VDVDRHVPDLLPHPERQRQFVLAVVNDVFVVHGHVLAAVRLQQRRQHLQERLVLALPLRRRRGRRQHRGREGDDQLPHGRLPENDARGGSIIPVGPLKQETPMNESSAAPTLHDRFRGCLLGLAVGDALGGRFEAQSPDALRARFPTVASLIDDYPKDELWYTDDTQMAIGVAETLAEHHEILEEHLCRAFVANYVPSRGYGRGARAVLEAMEEGRDHRRVAAEHFPGGSFGDGAAIPVA